jgi:hypothetical protein
MKAVFLLDSSESELKFNFQSMTPFNPENFCPMSLKTAVLKFVGYDIYRDQTLQKLLDLAKGMKDINVGICCKNAMLVRIKKL